MSRTRKGRKGLGAEIWSKRPPVKVKGAQPGPYAKRLTHRAERREAKEVIKEQTKCSPS